MIVSHAFLNIIILYSSVVLLHQLCYATENRSHHVIAHRAHAHHHFESTSIALSDDIALKFCKNVFRPELEGKTFEVYFKWTWFT